MDETQRRKALNEAAFRSVNESIEALHRRFHLGRDEGFEILCECDRTSCIDKLTVTLEVYERVRADPTLFFVRPGHEDPQVEDVLDAGGEYAVVRKRQGEPAAVAAATDPRS